MIDKRLQHLDKQMNETVLKDIQVHDMQTFKRKVHTAQRKNYYHISKSIVRKVSIAAIFTLLIALGMFLEREFHNQPRTLSEVKQIADEINTRGNTIGNQMNGGLLAQQGEWIYFSNANDAGKLYRMKIDKTGKEKLSDDVVRSVNVVGDAIYYCKDDDSEEGSSGYHIYEIGIDGLNRKLLNEATVTPNITVVDGWIYFIKENEMVDGKKISQSVCRMRPDGTDEEVIKRGITAYGVYVLNDWVYWNERVQSGAEKKVDIYRVKVDGSTEEKLYTNGKMIGLATQSGTIYFTKKQDTKLFRMDIDGTNQERLAAIRAKKLAIVGEWIYFPSVQDNHLQRVRLSGEDLQNIADLQGDVMKVNQVNVTDNYLYFNTRNNEWRLIPLKELMEAR